MIHPTKISDKQH